MAKLELESNTDVLLLESGDALLLELMEHEVNSAISIGKAVTATRRVDYKRIASFDR